MQSEQRNTVIKKKVTSIQSKEEVPWLKQTMDFSEVSTVSLTPSTNVVSVAPVKPDSPLTLMDPETSSSNLPRAATGIVNAKNQGSEEETTVKLNSRMENVKPEVISGQVVEIKQDDVDVDRKVSDATTVTSSAYIKTNIAKAVKYGNDGGGSTNLDSKLAPDTLMVQSNMVQSNMMSLWCSDILPGENTMTLEPRLSCDEKTGETTLNIGQQG